jgi:hypothetical protein
MNARNAVLLCALALSIAGCGDGEASVKSGSGDRATFVVGGRTVTVQQSGTAKVKVDGAPEMDYDGPLGCGGRYFTTAFDSGLNLYFRWSSKDAYLLVGSELFYLSGPGERHGEQLQWDWEIDGKTILIRIGCPPPPPSPSLASGSSVPDACDVLTPAIARAVLRSRVREVRHDQETPFLSYCAYSSRTFGEIGAYVTTDEQIQSLTGWEQPAVSGFGDEAHGGNAGIGFSVRSGSLGFRVEVELPPLEDGELEAEKDAARRILADL